MMDSKAMADKYDRMADELSAQVESLAQDVVKLTQAENALANAHGICFAAMDSTRCIESGISSLGDNFTDVLVEGLSRYLDFSNIIFEMGNTDNKVLSLQENIIEIMKEIDIKQKELAQTIKNNKYEIENYRYQANYYRSLI